jgi:uncharacterized membrane protein YfcA
MATVVEEKVYVVKKIEVVDMSDQTQRMRRARRPRTLNIEGIKGAVVTAISGLLGTLSALTGIAPQTAFSPAITWMLGFGPEKAMGTATQFAVVVALAALVGAGIAHTITATLLWHALLLAVTATIGATIGVMASKALPGDVLRRLGPLVGTVLTLWVILQAAHIGQWNASAHLAHWNGPGGLALIGLVAGLVGQLLLLPAGLVMVPALYFLAGDSARMSILTSLAVICLASVVPARLYAARGLVDERYRLSWLGGGALGGIIGSVLLSKPFMDGKPALMLFAVCGMFLCARETARMAFQRAPKEQ